MILGACIVLSWNQAGATEYPTGQKALTVVDTSTLEDGALATYFNQSKISEEVRKRIEGVSYRKNKAIALEDLRYLKILYYGYDKKTHIGELIVNKKIAKDTLGVFLELYQIRYQIEKVQLVDEYDADDTASMEDNNTSAFNYRLIEGTNRLSNHARGLAIDLNPLYNPYVTKSGKKVKVSPEVAKKYADRTLKNVHYIKKNDACYRIFAEHGFTWGGNWNYSKDYQHFEKVK